MEEDGREAVGQAVLPKVGIEHHLHRADPHLSPRPPGATPVNRMKSRPIRSSSLRSLTSVLIADQPGRVGDDEHGTDVVEQGRQRWA